MVEVVASLCFIYLVSHIVSVRGGSFISEGVSFVLRFVFIYFVRGSFILFDDSNFFWVHMVCRSN